MATANTGKTQERFCEKMQVNGQDGYKSARRKFLAVGVASIAIYSRLKGRTVKLCVLNRC